MVLPLSDGSLEISQAVAQSRQNRQRGVSILTRFTVKRFGVSGQKAPGVGEARAVAVTASVEVHRSSLEAIVIEAG
jgi:hypothetical protein